MVTVSKKAADEFKKLLAERELPNTTKVRVGVELVPEQGDRVRLFLAFDTKPASDADTAQVSEGIEVVVEKELAGHLGDAQIDFVSEGSARGDFVFRQPEEAAE